MKLKIISPERVVLEAVVDEVYATATDGEFGILPKHMPLISALSIGMLRYKIAGQSYRAALMGGVLQTDGDTISVLTQAAELATEIDVLRAKEAEARAKALLAQREATLDIQRVQAALNRALTRLKVAATSS
jgi:F-type H+-transporting ATPase subunit epsilon